MGSPKFVKTLFVIAALIAGAYYGMKYLKENPDAADLQKVQPGVYQPQPPQQPGNRMVVVP